MPWGGFIVMKRVDNAVGWFYCNEEGGQCRGVVLL